MYVRSDALIDAKTKRSEEEIDKGHETLRCKGESEASEQGRIGRIGRKGELAGHDLDRPAVEWMQATVRLSYIH